MSDPVTPPKRRGCFFYGCLSCIIIALVVLVVGFFGVRYAAYRLNALIAEYTETIPVTLPKTDLPADELAKLKERATAFGNALDAHTNTPPLTLTGAEINALMQADPQMKNAKLSEHVYVSLEGSHIKAQVSLPLDQVHLPLVHTQGRYLNGVADVSASVTNSAIDLTLNSVAVKGKPLPGQFQLQLQQFLAQSVRQGINQNPTNSAYLGRLESVEVKDGVMTLKAKQ